MHASSSEPPGDKPRAIVLSRRAGESVVFGDPPEVTVTVVEIRGDRARLAVDAPPHVAVHRAEVYRSLLDDGPRTLPPVAGPRPPGR